MLASKPLVAASLVIPGLLLISYLWQKRRSEEEKRCQDYAASVGEAPSFVDSKEVSLKLETLNRSRLDCIEEERNEGLPEVIEEIYCNNIVSDKPTDKVIELSSSSSETNNSLESSRKASVVKAMTTEENIASEGVPDAVSVLKDPIASPLSSCPGEKEEMKVTELDSPVKSEASQKSESWSDLIDDEEVDVGSRASFMLNSLKLVSPEEKSCRNDSGVASPTDEFSRPETEAVVEKARISSGEDAGIGGSETGDVSDGNVDLNSDDAQIFSYQFHIQDYLTGSFIGAKGASINQLKVSCSCNVIVRDDYSQKRTKLKSKDRRYENGNMNLVILEGTRANIDKCLDKIRERFKSHPELTLEQINKPGNTSLSLNAGSVALCLVEGIMHDVVISSIVSGDQIFIQQPTNPTFSALERLDWCMNNTYSQLTCPGLSRPICPNSICVAPSNGGWFRCQVVSYDEAEDTCCVKYVDYGGYDNLAADQLKKIRTDFLTLPFQAIECRLANIIVDPSNSACISVLGELVTGQVIQARMLGVDEDNLPMVHIYRNSNGQTVMVNRELVDRNCADWIESKFVALDEIRPEDHWNILGDFSPSNNDFYQQCNLRCNYLPLNSSLPDPYDDVFLPRCVSPLPDLLPSPLPGLVDCTDDGWLDDDFHQRAVAESPGPFMYNNVI